MIVTITPDEVRRCAYLGVERWMTKKNSTDKESYAEGKKRGLLEHDLVSDTRANVCEWAVAKAFGLSWGGGFTYSDGSHTSRRFVPDVGDNKNPVEVRSRRKQQEFAFWPYELQKSGVMVFAEVVTDSPNHETFEEVRLLGWAFPEECANQELWDKEFKKYYVPVEVLRPMETLESEGLTA